jgi:hypothetical protein
MWRKWMTNFGCHPRSMPFPDPRRLKTPEARRSERDDAFTNRSLGSSHPTPRSLSRARWCKVDVIRSGNNERREQERKRRDQEHGRSE